MSNPSIELWQNPPFMPAMAPPPGVIPTYEQSEYFRTATVIAMSFQIVVPTITTAMRFSYKNFVIAKQELEDFLMYAAWVTTVGFAVFLYVGTVAGGGTHLWNLSVQQAVEFGKYAFILETLHAPTILFVKVSILLQIQRIFVVGKGNRRWTENLRYYLIQALIWTTSIFYAIIFLWVFFQCSPPKRSWDRSVPGTCLNNDAILIAVGIFAVLSDFAILALPITWAWKIKSSVRKRLWVCLIFAVALIGCAASILRLYYSVINYGNRDVTYGLYFVGLSSGGEGAAAILVGNMVFMPKMLAYTWDKARSKMQSLRSGGPSSAPVELVGSPTGRRPSSAVKISGETADVLPVKVARGNARKGQAFFVGDGVEWEEV